MTASPEAERGAAGAEDPRRGSAPARLARGAGYLGRGLRFVLDRPRLIPLCLLPLGIAALVFVLLVVLLVLHYGELANLIWARPASLVTRLLWYALYVFIFLLVMLLAYGAFFVAQALLASPFNDLLGERVEEIAAGRPPTPFSLERLARSTARTLLHQLVRLGAYVGIMLPLLLISLVVPVLGPALLLVGGWLLTAFFLGFDALELAMDRREWSLHRKWELLRANRALVLGLGGLLELALLVPVLGLLLLPAGAVGGTLLFCDLQRALASQPPRAAAPGSDGESVV